MGGREVSVLPGGGDEYTQAKDRQGAVIKPGDMLRLIGWGARVHVPRGELLCSTGIPVEGLMGTLNAIGYGGQLVVSLFRYGPVHVYPSQVTLDNSNKEDAADES